MNAAHLVQFSLGGLSTLLVLAFAHPMANFFGVPDATWALSVLAAVPVLRGLSHLDVYE